MSNWSDLYALDRFQQRQMIDYYDFYQPVNLGVDANKRIIEASFSHTPTFTLVPVRYVSTDDMEYSIDALGMQTTSNFVTQDIFRMHILQPCSTNWMLVCKTIRYDPDGTTHKDPRWGNVWMVEGEGKNDLYRPRMPINKRRVFAKFAVPPPGFSIALGAFS